MAGIADHGTTALPERFSDIPLTRDAQELINNPEIDIIVELIGGIEPAKTFVMQAIAAGKHVVTANKALLSQEGADIFAAAARQGVEVGFEASVGGGIPVIKALKEGLVANKILSIMGIMNGTANYILTRMTDEGVPFAEVLKDAQALGFAEADPTYDIEGIDTAHKLAILMTMCLWHADHPSPRSPPRASPGSSPWISSWPASSAAGSSCWPSAATTVTMSRPGCIPPWCRRITCWPRSAGPINAIHFHGDTVGNILLYGQGAGMMPTGSAVAADVVDIARNIACGSIGRVPALSYLPDQMQPRRITPMDELYGPYYFRITVLDQPGVLSAIAGILSKYEISIESVIQKGRKKTGAVPLVIVTHSAKESAVSGALAEIGQLETVTAPVVKIRILEEE